MPIASQVCNRRSRPRPAVMRRSRPVVVAPAARWRWPGWTAAWPAIVTVAVTALLFGLGVTNLVIRATWHEADDGVLWVGRVEGVTAFGVAPGTPAGRAGIRPGDLLEAIDGQFVERPSDVADLLHRATEGQPVTYRLLRLGTAEAFEFRLASIPRGNTSLYYVLAPVGLFTLLVGAVVRLRRPNHPATLHFLWLAAAFFGWAAFSFSGRLDRLDWLFYWADAAAVLLLPPLFLHFTFFFPERPRSWATSPFGSRLWQVVYLPALLLGVARLAAIARAVSNGQFYIGEVVQALDRFEPLYLSVYLGAGLVVITRAFGEVRTVTSQRQLRWIAWGTALGGLPFAFGYALPYAMGVVPTLPMELSAVPLSLIPLTFASAHRALPSGGRRGHRQARAGLGRCAGGRRRDLRGPAPGGGLAVPLGHARPHLDHRAAGDGRRGAGRQAAEERHPGDVRPRVLPRPVRLSAGAGRVRPRPEFRPRSRTASAIGSSPGSRRRCWSIAWRCSWRRSGRGSSRRFGRPGCRTRRCGSRAPLRWGPVSPPGPRLRWTTTSPPTGFRRRTWRRGATASCITSSRACRRRRRSPCWRSGARRTPSR